MSALEQQHGESHAREVGRRQALYREVNERLDALATSHDNDGEVTILCECGLPRCSDQIILGLEEYERLRLIPTHFAVVHGHALATVERIVEANGQYDIVEKFGESAIEAIKLDPRRRGR